MILVFLALCAPADDIPLLAHDDYVVREAAHNRLLLAINEHDEEHDVTSVIAGQLISEVTYGIDLESKWRCWLILKTHWEYRQTSDKWKRWKLLKESNTVLGDVWVLVHRHDTFPNWIARDGIDLEDETIRRFTPRGEVRFKKHPN